ncbi:MAG: glycoside hydrolase family 127 protein, partial [Chloroflexi bacterium]|nr:glycoside hydrolase family 127 protein [Chloroflexota bacterium]
MRVPIIDLLHSPCVKLQPLSITNIQLSDSLLAPRLEKNRTVTLPTQYHLLEATGRLRNFQWAAGAEESGFEGLVFNDSDVYKWVEAASFSLATHPDPSLEALVDHVITLIARAQQPDGYLNTYFTHDRQHLRWTNLTQQHEHYCAGHLIQAAIAHHRATGKSTLLAVAQRLADLICQTFGPHGRTGVDGHEEIEMALIELYRETHQQRYLDTALFFLDERGQEPPRLGHREYLQDHLPVREQSEAAGHAVRLTYLACGMADAAAETSDATLLEAADRLWHSAFSEKAYLTGGLGARYEGEAFGAPYELPQERAYAETCAAIGAMMWSWRMLQQRPEARFADILERLLYNGFLSGISLSGDAYFYVNPLADRGTHRRQPWFSCACCPPNIAA